jgi:drug/metabolite transporter (DMT)-like permease
MAAYFALGFLSLLWGTSFLLIKITAPAFGPVGFALARVGVAAATLIIVCAFLGVRMPRGATVWGKLLAMSLAGQVGPLLLLGAAAKYATSADMAMMMAGAPIFIFLLGWAMGVGDAWTLAAGFGLLLGLAGVLLALWAPGAHAAALNPTPGRALALAAAFCYAISAVISGEATRAVGAAMAVTASLTISTVLLAAIALAAGARPDLAGLAAIPRTAVAAMAMLGIVNTALGYFVYFRLIASAGPTFASLNNYVVPVVGTLAGALALREGVAPSAWAGLGLVLVGVTFTGRGRRGR